jgi:hypothetical protein
MIDAPRWIHSSSLAAALSLVLLVPDAGAQGRARTVHAGGRPQGTMSNRSARQASVPRSMGGARSYSRGYNRNAMANQNNGQMISQLHATMRLLAQADHDYQGHRARAMHEIGTAIRHLEPATARRNQPNPALAYLSAGNGNGNGNANGNGNGIRNGNGNGSGNGTGNGNGNGTRAGGGAGPKNRMPQAASDAHLRNALQSLSTMQAELANFGSAPNHVRAHAAVQSAIQELNVALNIR